MKTVEEVIHRFFGESEMTFESECGKYKSYSNSDFVVNVNLRKNKALFNVDLRKYYDKDSKCPIHFVVDFDRKLSSRKIGRIFDALNFLQRNKSSAGCYIGRIPGFDDLDYMVGADFYRD